MSVATSEFIDITGTNFGRAPLVKDTYRAVYVTGSGGIEETGTQLAALKNAGMGAITIDQTPGLGVFASGQAECADVEPFAGTDRSAAVAVAARQLHGIKEHTLYVSFGNLAALHGSILDQTGVGYWVADWSWSAKFAASMLAANPNWRAIQFGDPQSNPRTLVPGTSVDLAMAQCDIDLGLTSWLEQFLPSAPPPPPPPAVPKWPFGGGDYLGMPSTDHLDHSGYFSTVDNHVVAVWQQRMRDRGWYVKGARLVADGFYGPDTYQVCLEFQAEKKLLVSGKVGPNTWAAAWELAIT